MLRKLWNRIRGMTVEEKPMHSITSPAELEFEHGAATAIGMRDVNADSFAVNRKKKLFVVADGVGNKSGQIASRYVCRTVKHAFNSSTPNTLLKAALQADEKLQAAKTRREKVNGVLYEVKPLTTLTALHFGENNKAHIVHAGDSSIYRLRGNKLKKLTSPVEPGFQGIGGLYESLYEKQPPVVKFTDFKQGDVFLLCTDGVTGNEPGTWGGGRILSDEELKQALVKTAIGKQTPEQTAQDLVDLYGFRDSRTAIVVKVRRKV